MPEFTYTAMRRTGERFTGRMEAADRSFVLNELRTSGHFPVDVRPSTAGPAGGTFSNFNPFARRLSHAQITLLTRELAMLLKAGLTLDQALGVLAKVTTSAKLQQLAASLRRRLGEGKSFYSALDEQDGLFPPAYINMVRVGEASGTLEQVLERIASAREWEHNLRSKILSAIIYPGFLVLTAFGALFLILGFVVPRFKSIITTTGENIPESARFVFAASDWLVANASGLAIGTVALVVALAALLRQPLFRRKLADGLMNVPLVGHLYRLNFTVRFCRSLGTLLENGVDLPEALELSKTVVGNPAVAQVVSSAIESLRKGDDFTQPLADSKLFFPVAASLLKVGMETGSLAPSTFYLADMFEEKLEVAVKRTFTILEPLIIVLVSAFVAGIIISIIGAIISVNEIAI